MASLRPSYILAAAAGERGRLSLCLPAHRGSSRAESACPHDRDGPAAPGAMEGEQQPQPVMDATVTTSEGVSPLDGSGFASAMPVSQAPTAGGETGGSLLDGERRPLF